MTIFRIIKSAFWNTNNVYRSIVGYNVTNNFRNSKISEINYNNWTFGSLLILFSNLFVPSLPFKSPSWMPSFIERLLFKNNSKYIPDDTETEDEICVIFINGIMSEEKIVNKNKQLLKKILNRPVNIIHNVTDSLIVDLLECLIGKQTDDLTEPSTKTLYTLSQKLHDSEIKKIILICHSQGTIITGKAIKNLKLLGLDKEEYVKKIEIYAFSNCSSDMTYIEKNYPYIESFANENDLVAKMGCNCSDDIKELINIDGKLFVNKNSSGHMFNTHYFNNFSIDYSESKLNNYIKN